MGANKFAHQYTIKTWILKIVTHLVCKFFKLLTNSDEKNFQRVRELTEADSRVTYGDIKDLLKISSCQYKILQKYLWVKMFYAVGFYRTKGYPSESMPRKSENIVRLWSSISKLLLLSWLMSRERNNYGKKLR